MEIKKKQSTRKRSAARWIVVLLLLAVFLFSLYQTLRILYGYRQAKAVYENAERAYLIPVSRDETEAETERIPPAIDFEALQAVNKDVIGWIFIEGTEELSHTFGREQSTVSLSVLRKKIYGRGQYLFGLPLRRGF